MGTVIGSIYPVDNIVIEENASNSFSNAVNLGGLNQYDSIFKKYGLTPTKDINTMSLNELKSYRAILVRARNQADSNADKNLISGLIGLVDNLMKPLQKEKSQTFWSGVWDKLVTASGVEQNEVEQPIKVEEKEEEPKKTNYLLWGGIGVGVLLIGGIVYLSLSNKKNK